MELPDWTWIAPAMPPGFELLPPRMVTPPEIPEGDDPPSKVILPDRTAALPAARRMPPEVPEEELPELSAREPEDAVVDPVDRETSPEGPRDIPVFNERDPEEPCAAFDEEMSMVPVLPAASPDCKEREPEVVLPEPVDRRREPPASTPEPAEMSTGAPTRPRPGWIEMDPALPLFTSPV